jgi:hypothetical protein
MDKDKDREKMDRDERERGVKEQAKAGKEERDKFERDAKEQAAREKAERDKFERDAKEQAAREKAERERADKERERAERERLARDKAERERLEREAKEHAAREKAERERLERAKEQARKEEAIARKKAERERAERERLLKHQAYVGTPTAANTAPLLPLPQCVENVVPSEVSDLIFGTFLCALLVGAVGFFKGRKLRKQQNRAMHRSLSCPALVELKSTRAVKACADMLAAFDERSDGRRSKPAPYVPSMPRVAESAGENSNAWSPRSSPRQSPRTTPRDLSPRASPRASPRSLSPTPPRAAGGAGERHRVSPLLELPGNLQTSLLDLVRDLGMPERDEPEVSRSRRGQERDEPEVSRSRRGQDRDDAGWTTPQQASPGMAALHGSSPPTHSSDPHSEPPLFGSAMLSPLPLHVPRSACAMLVLPVPVSGVMGATPPLPLHRPTPSRSGGSGGGSGGGGLTAEGGWDSRQRSQRAGPASAVPATEASADAGSRDQEDPDQAIPDGGTGQAINSRSTTPLIPASPPVAAPAFVVPAWPSPTTTPSLPAVPGWPSPALPHLIVLGDAGVGKSTVIAVLEGFAASNNVLLSVVEGKPTAREALVAATPLVVWDAVDEQRGSLKVRRRPLMNPDDL